VLRAAQDIANPGSDRAAEQAILLALKGIRYGSVEIIVHDFKVVQIERKEKTRFDHLADDDDCTHQDIAVTGRRGRSIHQKGRQAGILSRSLWGALLSVPLLLLGTDKAKAVEYGELVEKDGKSVFKNTEDPVLKLLHDRHLIADEDYFKAMDRTGKNWIEPADAVLNQRRDLEWIHYEKALLHLPDWLDLALENRTRIESYDNPWRRVQAIGGGEPDTQLALRSRVRVGLGGESPLRLLFEGQDSRGFFDGDPGDYRTANTVNEFDILQLFGSLTVKNVFGTGLRTDVHFGRMTMDMGRRRLIARNDFRNTVNAFDGFHWQIGRDEKWRIRAFATQPVVRDMEEIDQQYDSFLLWGTYLESQHFPWFNTDVYYIGLNDQRLPVRGDPRLPARPATRDAHRTYTTVGGRLFKLPRPGELDYELETVWQTGRRGVMDHFAYFQHSEIGYTFNLPWIPRLLVNHDYASGDRPDDDQHQRFDTLFGARRFEAYGPTGIWGPFFRSNLNSLGWRLIVAPAPNVIVQFAHNVRYLAESTDSFVGSGLRDRTGNAGNELGQDVEIRAQWGVSHNLNFDVGYARWFKGSYLDNPAIIRAMPAGGNQDSNYFYASMRVRI
jgi:hypothetical protein